MNIHASHIVVANIPGINVENLKPLRNQSASSFPFQSLKKRSRWKYFKNTYIHSAWINVTMYIPYLANSLDLCNICRVYTVYTKPDQCPWKLESTDIDSATPLASRSHTEQLPCCFENTESWLLGMGTIQIMLYNFWMNAKSSLIGIGGEYDFAAPPLHFIECVRKDPRHYYFCAKAYHWLLDKECAAVLGLIPVDLNYILIFFL